MPRAATASQADIARACRALEKTGLGVARVEIRPDGTIAVIPGAPQHETPTLEGKPIVL